MSLEGGLTLLRKLIAEDKQFIDACFLEDACLTCVHRETKKRKYMSFTVMYENNKQFWLQNSTWEYFLAPDEVATVRERLARLSTLWEPSITSFDADVLKEAVDETAQSFGQEYEAITAMTETERVMHITAGKDRLESLIAQKPRQEQLVTEALVETTRDAVLYNHATLVSAMKVMGDEAKNQTRDLVESTRELVKISSQLITSSIFHDDLMNTLVEKSNGTIIQHMTRVYLKGLAFLSYYNKLVSTSSIINRLRIVFAERYQDFYQPLLPHIHADFLTLEQVFLGGMRAISEAAYYNWAMGFLVHDIGKAGAVEYHEGEAEYNRDIVMEHVKIGYTSVMNKTNYPVEAGLITGYHHEYYGDPAGYGFYRTSLEQAKIVNPQLKQHHCIAYDVEPVLSCEVLAFFPAKVLEIIDVFDSLTDPSRKYKKAMTTDEALVMMQDEFVIKHHKLDKILFDIFVKFVKDVPGS